MYSKHFNLKENPFSIAPDPRYLYMSNKHREALAHLMYGLETDGGFVLLTGEVGTGKTTVCRCLLEQLPNDINVAFVLNPKQTSAELLATVCDEFGIGYQPGHGSIKELVDNINRYLLATHARGRKTVLIIDEAQNLGAEVLEQIRLLTNLETNQRKLLQIVMLGQPELRDQLARPELRQLAQRITARYHLGPLARNEIAPYINHRLGVAGRHMKLFPDKLINKIYRLTNGIPRLINVICDRALLGTYAEGREKVNHPTLKKAAREVLGPAGRPGRLLKGLAAAVLVLICLALAALFFSSRRPAPPDSPSGGAPVVKALPPAAPLAWPAEIPRADSYPMAFGVLLASWDRVYRESLGAPCDQAASQGLACLERQGNLGSLRHLNRPAVLRLIDREGRGFYAPLLKLSDSKATLLINTKRVTVGTIALEKQWFGDYTLLWQPPPGYRGPIKPDHKGATAEWLASRIAAATGRPATGADLGQLVTAFQESAGLLADGIAGPDTLIHLNSNLGRNSPTLGEE
jgi:general secretion pathway protein A